MTQDRETVLIERLLDLARALFDNQRSISPIGDFDLSEAMNLLLGRLSLVAINSDLRDVRVSNTTASLYDVGDYIVSLTSSSDTNGYLYLRGQRYVDLPLLSEGEFLHVETRLYTGEAPLNFDLSHNLSGSRLELSRKSEVGSGNAVVNFDLSSTSEVLGAKPFSILRIIEKSTTPYELLFERSSTNFCGVMQRNSRESTILSALELCSEMRLVQFIDETVRLTDDENPIICWSALRALKTAPQETIGQIIEKFRKSPNEYLRASASAIRYGD